ncbi:MAG: FAD-dependent oxidoreductase [Pseudoxanthomonas sp.]
MLQNASRRIAIVGAGPAGLVAARILQLRGFNPTVFEADVSTGVRDQGGTLDLHPETGQRALELAGLHAAFLQQARFDDQDTRLLDHATAQPLFEEILPSGTGDRPEIDRKALRDLLLSSLRPDTVRWGHKLTSVEADAGSGRHVLTFINGNAEAFDLVIGADGAWSKVRAQLSGSVPSYTGVTFVECWLDDVDERHPDVAELIGHGTMFALHDNLGMIAQRNSHGHVRLYAGFRRSMDWAMALGVDPGESAQVRAALLQLFAGWSPRLLNIIESCLDVIVQRPIYMLPVDFNWHSKAGLTLVGDAAHLMPPVGLGVNLAMLDAAELAMALTPDGDWSEEIAQQEAIMQRRARQEAPDALATFNAMFASDSTIAVLQQMEMRREDATADSN